MDIQKMIDDAVEEFRKKLEKEFTELSGTQVELINKDLETVVYPVEEFDTGTLLNCGGWEAFLINDGPERRWVTFSGEQYSDEQLAVLLRHNGAKVMVIHWGL